MKMTFTRDELFTALLNLQWMRDNYRSGDGGEVIFQADGNDGILVHGSGGSDVELLTMKGFTPGTRARENEGKS